MVGVPELVIVTILIVLLFGVGRFTEIARQAGKALGRFQRESCVNLLPITTIAKSLPVIQNIDKTIDVKGDVVGKGIAIGENAKVIVIEEYTVAQPDLSRYVPAPLGVFVSLDESLNNERETVREAIQSLSGLSIPWLLDITRPTERHIDVMADYIRRCDVFLLITSGELSNLQLTENELALKNNIQNRFYLVSQEEKIDIVRNSIGDTESDVKKFTDSLDLSEQVKRALVTLLIESARDKNRYSLTSSDCLVLLGLGALLDIDKESLQEFHKWVNSNVSSNNTEQLQEMNLSLEARQLLKKAENLLIEGQYYEAVLVYSTVLYGEPNQIDALIGRATAHLYKNNDRLALKDLNRAAMLKPNLPDIYYYRGMAYESMKDSYESLANYSKAIEIDNNHIAALIFRARLYKLQGRYAQSLSDLNQLLQPESRIENYLGYVRNGKGSTKAYALRLRGDVNRLMGNHRQSELDLSEAKRLDPKVLNWE